MKYCEKVSITFFIYSLVFFAGCGNDDKRGRAAEKMYGINPTRPIHFVVPVGFHGKVSIIEDKANGVAPPILNGKITINVPGNGHLTLKDWSCFDSDHEETASYPDGAAIPNPDMVAVGSIFPKNKVGFWILGVDHAGGMGGPKTIVRFIGTKDELDALH